MPMARLYPWCVAAVFLAVLTAMCGTSAAQQRSGRSATQTPELPGAVSYLKSRLDLLDREIAQHAMRRNDTPAGEIPILEMQIDLRIVARWMLSVAAEAKPDTEEQVNGFLRATHLLNAAARLEEMLAQQVASRQPLTRLQNDAMVRLHQLSYNLPEEKNAATLDEVSRNAGTLMLRIASPVGQVQNPPTMRPDPAKGPERQRGGRSERSNAPQPPRTVAQLTSEISAITVSIPLRQQLLALAQQTAQAAEDKSDDYNELYTVLTDAVDLARGLASNTAVAVGTRNAIERQLAEGIALYCDSRTRSAGQTRLQGMSQYRQVLSRIGRLQLPQDIKSQLGPLFAWIQDNPDSGLKLLAALDRHTAMSARYDASMRNATTTENLRRALEESRRQFELLRHAFLEQAKLIPAQGMMGARPDEVVAIVDQMQSTMRVIELIVAMPKMVDTLNAYRPRPTGGLERRIAVSALAAANVADRPAAASARPPTQQEGLQLLEQVATLATAAQSLQAGLPEELPSDGVALASGGRYAEMEAKWRQLVGELASQLAAGGDMDRAMLDRLAVVHELRQAMRSAIILQDRSRKGALLPRWADWTIAPDQLQAVLAPWRQALVDAFAGFVEDRSDAILRWQRINRRFGPLVALVERAHGYADQLVTMPTGLQGDIGRLITPMAGQPFAAERYASFAIELWSAWEHQGDIANGDTVTYVLARRLARELRLPFRDDESGSVRANGTANGPTRRTIFD